MQSAKAMNTRRALAAPGAAPPDGGWGKPVAGGWTGSASVMRGGGFRVDRIVAWRCKDARLETGNREMIGLPARRNQSKRPKTQGIVNDLLQQLAAPETTAKTSPRIARMKTDENKAMKPVVFCPC
jgi:hypothetical protein